ncbi:RUN domain-containing protein 1 [Blattella germanica]|nr:RUN domain-containing protein 1 [Blattella germanica]
MMEEIHNTSEIEDLDFYDGKPAGERWAPLGANDLDDEPTCYLQNNNRQNFLDVEQSLWKDNAHGLTEADRLRDLEEQQELLNSSLIALTTHFAQVQFRLRQIVDAPPTEKESLLKDLEAFAFRGIPELRDGKIKGLMSPSSNPEGEDLEEKMLAQRAKQKELISQLKSQLEDLEKYAYETGEAGLPQSVVMERQRVIIDQLKGKLNLNVDDMDKLTVDDLRSQVDYAISQLVNPLKMKEHLVTQLKTQISDLERFIEFLQGEGTSEKSLKNRTCTCNCPVHGGLSSITRRKLQNKNDDEIRAETINIMKKAATLLQIFAVAQFGCGSEHFKKNTLKKTMKANHFGDLRANLEMAVDYVVELASNPESPLDSDYTSDSEDAPVVLCNVKLTSAVRKQLALSIRDLMQHGLMPVGQSVSVVPFIGCFPQMNTIGKNMHAWELILKYYELKNGERYNSTPARKLSQSFNLEIVGGQAISNKQVVEFESIA